MIDDVWADDDNLTQSFSNKFYLEVYIYIFVKWSEPGHVLFADKTSGTYFYWVVFNFEASILQVSN